MSLSQKRGSICFIYILSICKRKSDMTGCSYLDIHNMWELSYFVLIVPFGPRLEI